MQVKGHWTTTVQTSSLKEFISYYFCCSLRMKIYLDDKRPLCMSLVIKKKLLLILNSQYIYAFTELE